MSSELTIPDDIAANPEGIDLMRAWVLKNQLDVSYPSGGPHLFFALSFINHAPSAVWRKDVIHRTDTQSQSLFASIVWTRTGPPIGGPFWPSCQNLLGFREPNPSRLLICHSMV